jgi:flavin-binding protein dodecin
MLNLYRQLLQDVLSDSPILLPVDADTAPRSSIQALKRLGKQLEKAWDKIQEQHQKTDLQVNTLLQALNISASDFTETYHDNIEQSLQNSIHEAETILSNLEAQLVAETEGFSVQANNGKPQQRQKLQEQIQKVKDSLQTLKELTVDGSSYAIETAKSVEKQLRNQMQQLQNIAQKYGPDALQQVQQFYAKMDSVFGWMPQWQFSAQVRSSFLSLCFKNQIPLDYYKNVPMSLRGDEGYVNVDKFTQQGKKGALVDPKTKYSLSKDRAINSGSGPHGESYWKLYDSKGSRVGTLAKDGKYIRK